MRRDQLEHAIRTACHLAERASRAASAGIHRRAVVVVGSQAILGTATLGQRPPEATMSVAVDILRPHRDQPTEQDYR